MTFRLLYNVRLYADDILLYSEIGFINNCTRLQNDINYLFNWSETWLLQFNPAKCIHLWITNKHSYIKFTYCLDKSIIKEVPSANYLGITIDSKLTWSDHVIRVVAKANSVLGFLQRNLKYCPPEIKASCFNSLVIPILEYGCTSWFPRFQKDTYAIEMVQQRPVRFIFNDYSYNTSVTSLLNTLNWPTLQNCRINLRAIMFYKIVNNLIGIPAGSFLLHNSSSTRHHHHCYSVPYSRINTHLFSFFPFTIRIWNHLSSHKACSPSLKIFKDRILKENLTTRLTLNS